MSGTFAYDGYIYQTNISLYLSMKAIKNREGLYSILIEVRKPSIKKRSITDYSVDLIVICTLKTDIICNIYEIKGGSINEKHFKSIEDNLNKCQQDAENYIKFEIKGFEKCIVTYKKY